MEVLERFAPDYLYPTRSGAQIKEVSELLRTIKIQLKKLKGSRDLESSAQLKQVGEIKRQYAEKEQILTHNEQLLKRNLLEVYDYTQEAKAVLLAKAEEAYEKQEIDMAGKYTLEASQYNCVLPDFVSIRQKLSFVASKISEVAPNFLELNDMAIKAKLKQEPDAVLTGIKVIQQPSISILTKMKGE